jgi:hypothetical protein
MRIQLSVIGIILACALILSARARPSARQAEFGLHSMVPASLAAKDSKNDCLGCHGPYDKIIEATANYTAPSGEKTSPHKYVPHDSKREEEIPECSECHTAHPLDPLPAPGSIDLSKVSVQWCYTACHHEKDLTSCKKCHP